MIEIGERLRRARQDAGLSLERLSARTKIQVAFLAAIECGEFARLPGGVFTRGFLRTYAREVGLDGDRIVREYVDAIEPPSPNPELPRADRDDSSLGIAGSHSAQRLWPVLAVAALLLVVLFVVGRDRSVAPVAEPTSTPSLGADGPREPRPQATSGEPAGAARPAAAPLILEIRPVGPVWVAASADGTRRVYRLMEAGEHEIVRAEEEIAVRVGDAVAFQYLVNGEPGRPLGGPGEVRDLRITPENFRTWQR
jgi:cytoskeleton protein RodZ